MKRLVQKACPVALAAGLVFAPSSSGLPGDPCHPDCGGEINIPPTVTLGVNASTGPRGQIFTFSASASDDNGDALTYSWDLNGDGTYGDSPGTVPVEGNFSIGQSYASLGPKTVGVRVTDGIDTDTDTEGVEVVNRSPTAGFTKSPTSPLSGETVTFTANAGDPDGDSLTYAWEWDGDDDFFDAFGPTASRSFATPGAYTVKLRVRDPFSAQAIAGATGNVTIGNRAPTASFTRFPTAPLVGEVVSFDSTGSSDPDGSVASRAWDLDDDGEFDDGAGTTASRNFLFPGTYSISLRVTDNLSQSATREDTVTVGQPSTGTGDGSGATGDTGTGGTGGGTTGDSAPPTLSFKAATQRSLRTKRMVFKVMPNETCQLLATAKLRRRSLGRLQKSLAANVTSTQRMRVSKRGLGVLANALRRKPAVKVSLAMRCADAAGNVGKVTKTVTIRR